MRDKMKSEMLQVLNCPICHESATNANLCPKCCQHFCHDCIVEWFIQGRNTCPKCRAGLTVESLLKCPTFDELQTAIQQARQTDRCELHEMHELSMFCYPCETCICPSCSYSEHHVEHKERIVPLEVAIEHYKQTLGQNLDWVSERRAEVTEALDQAQRNQNLLQEVKDDIVKTHEAITKLIVGESNLTTLQEMMETEKAITEAKLQSKTRKLLPSGYKDHFVPEATTLIFRFAKFDETIENNNMHEAVVTSCGFIWSCKLEKDEDNYYVYLKLVQGKTSKYGVYFDGYKDDENYEYLVVNKEVYIWTADLKQFVADEDGNTLKLTVYVRQSYEDMLKQLQDYSAQLEEEKAKSQASWKNLSKSWKKYAPY